MGGRLLDWLGAGVASALPDPVTDMPSRIVPGSTAFYWAKDTQHLFVYDEAGPSWFDIDMAAITAVTSESIQDMIATFLVNGTGITLTYNDAGNQLTIACTITQYTDEMAQDAIAALLTDGGGLTPTYDDVGNLLSLRNSRFMIPFWFESAPTADEVLARYIATDAFTLPANLSTSKGTVATAPAADFTITIAQQTNATGAFTTVGTIVIHNDGSITLATVGGTSKSVAVNDVLRFTAQHMTDATIQGGVFNIRGQ